MKQNKKNYKKIYPYLFNNFPFQNDKLNYTDYWKKYKYIKVEKIYRYKLIGEIITPGSNVLDIGCGEGSLLGYLKKEKNVEGEGIDISEEAIKIAHQKGVKAEIMDITREDYAIEKKYDYIIISSVLEHIPNPEELILKIKNNFTQNLLIIVPNTGFIADRARLLSGRFPKQWIFHPSEHLRFWSVKDFIFWNDQLGLKVEKYFGTIEDYYKLKYLPNLWKYFPKLFSKDILYQTSVK